MSQRNRIMEGAAYWAAYYRENPDKFVKDYLHIDLRVFQKILIVMMNWASNFVFIGSRGAGKSFLSAIFCVVKCILYPGTLICVASGTRGQAITILEKINLILKPRSPELRAEIDEKESKINGTNAQIVFKNGSYIKVVTASDSARSNRATLLLLDEFRLISKSVIDEVLRKFLTQKRTPTYSSLSEEERNAEWDKEHNITMWLSSAYMTDHWSYTRCRDTCRMMLDENRRQFVCGLPYQLMVEERIIDREGIEAEVSESDFNEIKFTMEYEALWWGSGEDAFFDFASVSKNRHIRYPMLPSSLASKLGNNQSVRIPHKVPGELRILSADIALMSSRKNDNDASAIFINQLMPTKAKKYTNNIVYAVNEEGMHTEDQALMIRRLYDEYMCDYIVLDCQGIGMGVYDLLVREITDPETGEIYPPLNCCNDSTMALRCTDHDAEKVIWSVKASSQFNSDCAFLLREGFRSGKIRLLINEYDAEAALADIPGYTKLSPAEQVKLQVPYINTTLLIDEIVNLQYEESNGRIKIQEKSGRRKDRYSSLSYNYMVACQLEAKLNRRRDDDIVTEDFIFRAPKIKSERW